MFENGKHNDYQTGENQFYTSFKLNFSQFNVKHFNASLDIIDDQLNPRYRKYDTNSFVIIDKFEFIS